MAEFSCAILKKEVVRYSIRVFLGGRIWKDIQIRGNWIAALFKIWKRFINRFLFPFLPKLIKSKVAEMSEDLQIAKISNTLKVSDREQSKINAKAVRTCQRKCWGLLVLSDSCASLLWCISARLKEETTSGTDSYLLLECLRSKFTKVFRLLALRHLSYLWN